MEEHRSLGYCWVGLWLSASARANLSSRVEAPIPNRSFLESCQRPRSVVRASVCGIRQTPISLRSFLRFFEIRFRRGSEGCLEYLEEVDDPELLSGNVTEFGSVGIRVHSDHGCRQDYYSGDIHIGLITRAFANAQITGYPKSSSYQRVAKFSLRGYL